MFGDRYRGKRVFVTGHTGFKGSWLTEWLLELGAEVAGFSIQVNESPDHFSALGLESRMTHMIGDVRDAQALDRALESAQPDFVFHLAAQPLVRRSYRDPVETMSTNVMGTIHLLDALRRSSKRVACVIVTSDKCYENREVLRGYHEDDAMGGHDPYSASKGAAEIVTQAFRRSYFSSEDSPVALATARAGNVIGGGDWSHDRIVPDCVRALTRDESIRVRNPAATRPWQHVLEPLSGYLWLGALLTGDIALPRVTAARDVSGSFNFGPWPESNRSVRALVTELFRHWPGRWDDASERDAMHEAGLLSLAIDKAFHVLQWAPVWGFARSVEATATWYRGVVRERASAIELTRRDIDAYVSDARRARVPWSLSLPE